MTMDFKALSDYIDGVEKRGIPAFDYVVYQNHQQVFRKSFGFSDAKKTKPISTTDLNWLYSATKVVTSTGAMRLIEQGKMGLDDPVEKYLPAAKNIKVHTENGCRSPKTVMTLRHLFTMTAGLTYDFNSPHLKEARQDKNAGTQKIVEAILKDGLQFDPGANFNYSFCHDVLAAVVEKVADKPFHSYLQDALFTPLGMSDTTFHPTPAQQKRLTQQYNYNAQTKHFDCMEQTNCYRFTDHYDSGGAGLCAPVDDYIKLVDALSCDGVSKDGYRVLKRESIDQMRENQLKGVCLQSFWKQPEYGYGLGVRTLIDKSHGAKSPIGEFGWDGAASAYTLVDVENHISVFLGIHIKSLGPGYFTQEELRDYTYEGFGF